MIETIARKIGPYEPSEPSEPNSDNYLNDKYYKNRYKSTFIIALLLT